MQKVCTCILPYVTQYSNKRTKHIAKPELTYSKPISKKLTPAAGMSTSKLSLDVSRSSRNSLQAASSPGHDLGSVMLLDLRELGWPEA